MAKLPPAPDRLTPVFHVIAGLALAVMMLTVVLDVAMDALLGTPLRGSYDIVSIALLVMVCFGIGPVVARQGEIVIDLLDAVLPLWALRLLGLAAALGGLAVFGFIGWSMLPPALDAWRWGEVSLELGLPRWPLWGLAFIGLAGIVWGFMVQIRLVWRRGPGRASAEEGAL